MLAEQQQPQQQQQQFTGVEYTPSSVLMQRTGNTAVFVIN